jgi:flagellar hook-length control protein FliK
MDAKTAAGEKAQPTLPVNEAGNADNAAEVEADDSLIGVKQATPPSASGNDSVPDPGQDERLENSLPRATTDPPQEHTASAVQVEAAVPRKRAAQPSPATGTPAATEPVANENSPPPESISPAFRSPETESQPEGHRDGSNEIAAVPAAAQETDSNAANGQSRKRAAPRSVPANTPPPKQAVVEENPQATAPTSPSLDAETQQVGRRDSLNDVSPAPAISKETDSNAANGQRFAQHLVAQNGERAAKEFDLNSADQARFVDRVARAFRAAEGRNGVVRLRLSPPELGSLRLEIKVQGSALAARLEADTPLARSLLMDNLPMLRERLADQGIRVEQFDVELLDRQSSGDFEGWDQRQQRHMDKGERSDAADRSPEPPEEPPFGEHPGKHPGEDEQLNVVI